jgi:hypothetical protein
MREEINRLETDLKNTTLEIANIEKMKRHLKWFLVLGALTAPVGFLWHLLLCFVIFGLFLILYGTAYYISYGHTKGLNRRRGAILERLQQLGVRHTKL